MSYRVHVFPEAVATTQAVTIDYNQQLQDLVDSSNNVKTAVEAIDQATPTDLTPLLAKLDAQIGLIDSFKQQSDTNQLSTKVAVDSVKTAVDSVRGTLEDEFENLVEAIGEASEEERFNLTQQLAATRGALESTLVSEFNESQAILTGISDKTDTLIQRLTLSDEALVPVSANIDTSDGPKEIVLPAMWAMADIGPNFRDASGAQNLNGASFEVIIGGRTEPVVKNGEWKRDYRVGVLGKMKPTLGVRIVIHQAPSTTHVVFDYPASQAPAAIVATPISEGTPAQPSGPSPEQLITNLAGNVVDANDSPFVEDIVGVWDFINVAGANLQQSIITNRVAEPQADFSNTFRVITEDEYNAFKALTREQVGAIMVANHSRFIPMVGNVYNLSDGAPYTDDMIGLKIAAVNGTFADVTTGPNAARIDTDGDGTGDRAITQFEYDSLRALDIGYAQQIQAAA